MKRVILTVAGFDPTGGAGLSTDIKTCSFLGVPNISVISSIVIQDPYSVKRKIDVDPLVFRQQLETLAGFYDISLINVGLFSDIQNLKFILKSFPGIRIILDPVFTSGSGKFRFLTANQIIELKSLLDNIFLITPNIPEACSLSGIEIRSISDMKESARIIRKVMRVENVLLKGGHLQAENKKSIDILLDIQGFYEIESQLSNFRVHGTGSFLNSAIAAFIFKGESLRSSFSKAHKLLHDRIKLVSENDPVLRLT